METPKTQVKSYRLNSEVIERIRSIARREGVSENLFVQRLLLARVNADPFIRAFPLIVLGKDSFSQIMGMTNPAGLELAATELGRKSFALARELYESEGEELDLRQYMTDVLDKQGHWFETDGLVRSPERLTLRHGYGMKWSVFLKGFLTGANEAVSPQRMGIRVTERYLALEYHR